MADDLGVLTGRAFSEAVVKGLRFPRMEKTFLKGPAGGFDVSVVSLSSLRRSTMLLGGLLGGLLALSVRESLKRGFEEERGGVELMFGDAHCACWSGGESEGKTRRRRRRRRRSTRLRDRRRMDKLKPHPQARLGSDLSVT